MSGHDRQGTTRFVLSLIAVVAIVIAVPAAVVAVTRARFGSVNPLAGVRIGSPSSLAEPISDQTVLDGLIRLSLCAVVVAVAVIIVTTVLEVIHMIRHRGLSMPPVRGLGWAQRIARFIAVGLLVVIPVVTPHPSIASTMARAPAARDITRPSMPTPVRRASDRPAAERSVDAPASAASIAHLVRPGESVYSIAEGLSGGDADRVLAIAEAIVDANLGALMRPGQQFTNPAYIEVGWVLQIPSHLVPPSKVLPAKDAEATTADADATYEVQAGDTLWDIADEQLGDARAWQTIWERNAGHDMGDGRTFDDPDLILPGWQLRLAEPELPAQETGDARATSDASGVDEPAVVLSDVVEVDTSATDVDTSATRRPEAEISDVAALPGDESGSSAPGVASTAASTPASIPASPAASSATSTVPPASGGPDPRSIEPGTDPPGDAPSPIRLEHAALFAAGVLALVAVRRRRRLRAAEPRHRVPPPRPDVIDTERRLRSIDAGERAMRVDVACRAAASQLLGSGAQIGWAEVTSDGDVDLRLSRTAELPPPWSGTGQDWHLSADVPVELLGEAARRVGLPCIALVQIGVTSTGADLLVDVEACGSLAVEAPEEQATEIVTALAAGLASSMYAEVAHLIAVSLPPAALLGHRNAHHVATAEAAMELATALGGSTVDNEQTTFELRSLHTGGEVWEPAIVVLAGTEGLAVRSLPRPGHGIGLVVAAQPGELVDSSVRLANRPDGWCLEGFGTAVAVSPVGLSDAELQAVDDVLVDAEGALESIELASVAEVRWADTAVDPGDIEPVPIVPAPVEPAPVDPGDDETVPFVPMDHRIVVALLGAIRVTDREGVSGRFERSKTVELIAWLATHRERSTRTGARTALWELDVRDATFANVVSEARRGLGRLIPPPGGEEWVGRTLTDQLPLHTAVVTDADLVSERVDHARVQPPAQALDTLRPAVAMIRDIPFAGTSYLWPDAEGITSNLVLLAITAAAEFAGHALSLGDTEGVFWATGHGLKVLPGHEELIGLRMRAHARAGDLAGVRQEWESYERIIVADAWSDGEPAPKLLELRRELLATGSEEHRNVR